VRHGSHGFRRGLITVAAPAASAAPSGAWGRWVALFPRLLPWAGYGRRFRGSKGNRGHHGTLDPRPVPAARCYGDVIVRPTSQAGRALLAATRRSPAHHDLGFRRVKPGRAGFARRDSSHTGTTRHWISAGETRPTVPVPCCGTTARQPSPRPAPSRSRF